MSKDYFSMSKQELEEAGFQLWNEDSELMLIPLKLFPEILLSVGKTLKGDAIS